MITSLVSWSVVCYFINRLDVVIKAVACRGDSESVEVQTSGVQTFSLPSQTESSVPSAVTTSADVQIAQCIQKAFEEDKVYLNPKLRLSDLADSIGTNRTYMSQYFNQTCEQSFYEYVNDYRIGHSMQLMSDTDLTLEVVADMSGFNSLSTFRRAFIQKTGAVRSNIVAKWLYRCLICYASHRNSNRTPIWMHVLRVAFLPFGIFFYILTSAYSEDFYNFATAVKTYNTCISIY